MNIIDQKNVDVREIPLTHGFAAIVDATDFEFLNQWKWHTVNWNSQSPSYAIRRVYTPSGNVNIRMHRLILEHQGIDLTGKLVDHIDGDGLNNRLSNLRAATAKENARNRGKNNNSHSKYKRVCKAGVNNWYSSIEVDGTSIYLGCFPTPEEAALAYNQAAIKHFGEFAQLNQVSEQIRISERLTCLACGKELRRDAKYPYCVQHRKLRPGYRGYNQNVVHEIDDSGLIVLPTCLFCGKRLRQGNFTPYCKEHKWKKNRH